MAERDWGTEILNHAGREKITYGQAREWFRENVPDYMKAEQAAQSTVEDLGAQKEADKPLEIGDVVQMKSGGPRMTVRGIGEDAPLGDEADVPMIQTSWFDNKGGPRSTDSWLPASMFKRSTMKKEKGQ